MAGSFTIGTAHRSPVQRTPIIHILVLQAGDWAMWCSGSKGREDNPYGDRRCRKCRTLAREAHDKEMLDSSEVGQEWFTGEQLSRERQD
jgi:hypothetical protein